MTEYLINNLVLLYLLLVYEKPNGLILQKERKNSINT